MALALEDSLFADDSTLIRTKIELKTKKEVVKERMMDFEEKHHNGKKEFITFATKNALNTRMPRTRIGKLEDRAARVKQGFHAWKKVKRWIGN